MNDHRRSAVAVGILYILGTVFGVLSVACTQSILQAPDFLRQIAANPTAMVAGTLCVLAMALSLSMIPVILHPILKRRHPVLALGYVVFRGALECVASLIFVVLWLLLILLAQDAAAPTDPGAPWFATLGKLLLRGHALSGGTLSVFLFGAGAVMLYTMLYRARLVPRWIAVWGFIAIGLHIATGFMILFQADTGFSLANTLMNLPIFLQEMVMAVWLIARGFDRGALAALAAPQGAATGAT